MIKHGLSNGKKKVGEREAKRISEIATRRGSAVHGICERYVRNDPDYFEGVMPVHQCMFSSIKWILDKHVDNVYGVEIPLYSLALKTAGRTDLVANYDGIPTVIDYKTSKKVKFESQILSYFLQSTVYSMMFEQRYRISVPQIVIIIAVDDEPKPQVFIRERGLYVKQVLSIFNRG